MTLSAAAQKYKELFKDLAEAEKSQADSVLSNLLNQLDDCWWKMSEEERIEISSWASTLDN